MHEEETQTIFEKSQEGQHAYSLPKSVEDFHQYSPPKAFQRQETIPLAEISEIDLTRHFTSLSRRNMGIDTHFYPLGSCTMKLNPRVNEYCAAIPAFARSHPLAPDEFVQGNLQLIHSLIEELCQVTRMEAGSLASNAGAQGEFAGLQMIRAYHASRGDTPRNEILVPDDAHGTNPASASMAGFKIIPIRTHDEGQLCLDHLQEVVSEKTAGLMLTNPNTLGLFHKGIKEVARIVHQSGGLLYYDGANLNAILNVSQPGEMGFDVMHINLHKTFSTPHGGGGPGSGPVLCNTRLMPFLPLPKVSKVGVNYKSIWKDSSSIGYLTSFHGNFSVYLRAFTYIKLHGHYGLRKIAEGAIINANYLKKKLSEVLKVPYPQHCMHEFVVQVDSFLDKGIRALDIAKRLLDYGVHAPTMYFPLIVKECMLIEPTESESKKTLDRFVEIIKQIIKEIENDPMIVQKAPSTAFRSRLDEVKAAKEVKVHAFI